MFTHFLEETLAWKKQFELVWPLMPSIESLLAYLEATSKFQAIVNIKTKKPCLLTQFSVKV